MCEGASDLEIAKVWVEQPRRAAKEHQCASCCAPIRVGEVHLEHVNILDTPLRERMCFACWWAREDFHAEHGGALMMPSMLEDFLRECARWDEASEARWGAYLAALRARAPRAVGA